MNMSSNKMHCIVFLKIRFIILRSKDYIFFLGCSYILKTLIVKVFVFYLSLCSLVSKQKLQKVGDD